MLEDEERPGPEEVLEEYLSYNSPEDWLVEEVCDYLFRDVPEGELTDRIGRFDEVISNERDALLEDTLGLNDVALFTIFVQRGEDSEFLSFRDCPSAALLLESCVQMAEAGDAVHVEVVYGDGSRTEYALKWPFPMYVAVEVTTPALRDPDMSAIEFFGIVEQFGQRALKIVDPEVPEPSSDTPTLFENYKPAINKVDAGDATAAVAFLGGLSVGLWLAIRTLVRAIGRR